MSSPFLQIEEYLVSRFASLQGEIDDLKHQVKVLVTAYTGSSDVGLAVPSSLPKVTVTVTDIPTPAVEPKARKARKSRAKAPVATVPVALLSDDEVQVAASAPEPVAAPAARIVTSGELVAAVQLFRATHGIEAARAMWARVAPNKNKISEVTDAERPAVLDAVNAEAAHAAK